MQTHLNTLSRSLSEAVSKREADVGTSARRPPAIDSNDLAGDE